jgi:hypothetical protein
MVNGVVIAFMSPSLSCHLFGVVVGGQLRVLRPGRGDDVHVMALGQSVAATSYHRRDTETKSVAPPVRVEMFQ